MKLELHSDGTGETPQLQCILIRNVHEAASRSNLGAAIC